MAIEIVGFGSHLPDCVLTNARLANMLDLDENWIMERTGIAERRIAAPNIATSDLATLAAGRALDSAGISPLEIDLIVLATANPDQPIPATACFVQANIGATNAVAFDISAACTGFIFALATACDMLQANENRNTALVIGSDIYSRSIDYSDKRTCVLLGDGSGCVVLRKNSNQQGGVLSSVLRSNGLLADIIYTSAGGTRMPADATTVKTGEHYLKMRGRDVKETVARLLPVLVAETLNAANLSVSEIRLIVPHQMNGVMLREFPKMIGVGREMVFETISWSGNTGAASVPIALDYAKKQGSICPGDKVLLLAFGAGVTWGGVVVEF